MKMSLYSFCLEDGELAPWLRELAALPEDLGSGPIPGVPARNPL